MGAPTWAWWVVRDDGDRCAGPFETRDEVEEKLRRVFDPSEYLVDYQYATPALLDQKEQSTDES